MTNVSFYNDINWRGKYAEERAETCLRQHAHFRTYCCCYYIPLRLLCKHDKLIRVTVDGLLL